MEDETPIDFDEHDVWGNVKPKPKYYERFDVEVLPPLDPDIKFASLGERIGASIIDGLVLGVVLYNFDRIFFDENYYQFHLSILASLTNFLLVVIYHGIFESSSLQATLGKILVGLQVIGEDGKKVSFRRAAFRYLLMFPFCIGFWNIITDKHKQGWHDMIAGCYIIHKRENVEEEEEDDDQKELKEDHPETES